LAKPPWARVRPEKRAKAAKSWRAMAGVDRSFVGVLLQVEFWARDSISGRKMQQLIAALGRVV
jgi:hypothetical protein